MQNVPLSRNKTYKHCKGLAQFYLFLPKTENEVKENFRSELTEEK